MKKILLFLILLFTLFLNGKAQAVFQSYSSNIIDSDVQQLTLTVPSGVNIGDLLVLILATDDNETVNTPSGWTFINVGDGGNAGPTLACYYRVANGTESPNYTITWGTNERAAGAIVRYSNVNTTNPIGVSGPNTGNNVSPTSPSINTSNNNSFIVRVYAADRYYLSGTYPSGHTGRFNITPGNNNNSVSLGMADQVQTTAGLTGTAVFSLTSAEQWRAISFSINEKVADLTIGKIVDDGAPATSDNVTFTLTAGNSGPDNATGVVVNDILPDGYTYISHSTATGTYDNVTGIWDIGNLNNLSNVILTITATVLCTGTYNNTADITGNESDPNSGNNSTTVPVSPVSGPCPLVVMDDDVTTSQGNPVTFNVLTNDNGNIDPNTLSITSQPNNGDLVLGTGGDITYLPNGGFTGTDVFTYQICDNQTIPQCDQANVTITINTDIIDPCIEAVYAKTYYLPFPGNATQLRKALYSSGSNYAAISNVERNVISIKTPYPNTVIYYDHWEDGYESDIHIPIQSTTLIWGDGILTNGVAPGYTNDTIPAGGYVVLDNNFIYNPRNASNIYFDGKDKIFTTADVSISVVSGDNSRYNIQNVKADVLDISRFGKLFVVGFGENITTNTTAFRYVSLFVRASEDGTLVNLDYNGDGTFDIVNQALNEGEVYFYDGTASTPGVVGDANQANDIKAGAVVTSNKPVGVDIIFGGIEGTGFATRNLKILPGKFYSDSYYNSVYQTNATYPVRAYFYNYNGTQITLNWENGSGGSGNFNINANSYGSLTLSAAAGYHFWSTGGESYTAVAVIGDSPTQGGYYDWAYSLIPEERLTTFSSIAWAPGSLDLLNNYNPIWVTPTANTTVYVKFDGNLTATGPYISTCGVPYDATYSVNALQGLQIYDSSDNDQTGSAVFTCDGTPFTAVWGQDANVAPAAGNSLDVGYIMQPKCLSNLINANDDYEVTEKNTPVIIGVVTNDVGFLCTVNPETVDTTFLLQPSHGTVVLNGNGTVTYTPETDWSGIDTFQYQVCSYEFTWVCDFANVIVKVTPCDANVAETLINGRVFIEQGTDNGVYDGEAFAGNVNVDLYADIDCQGDIDVGVDNIIESQLTNLSGFFSFSTPGGYSVKDDFDGVLPASTAFTGNDGAVNWTNNWTETGTVNGATTTPVTVAIDVTTGNNALIINGANQGVTRTKSFPNNVSDANLRFDYRRQDLNNANEAVDVILNFGTGQQITLFTISDGDDVGTDAYYQSANIIIPYANIIQNGNNTVRFVTNGSTANDDYFYIDNVQFSYYLSTTCFIVKVNPTSSYNASALFQEAVTISSMGTCVSDIYLGVTVIVDAIDDNVVANQDFPNIISVLANDDVSVPDLSSLVVTSQPTHGAVIVNTDGTVTYTPIIGYTGTDQFNYQICSLEDPAICDIATVYISVTCITQTGYNIINGFVYDDNNLDAAYTSGESGHSGVLIELYSDGSTIGVIDGSDAVIQTTNSSITGGYSFNIITPTVADSVFDQFNTNGSNSGSNGSVSWTYLWEEVGETNGFSSTRVAVANNRLEITDSDNTARGAKRRVDLSSALSATLTFDYTDISLDNATESFYVQISDDNTNWVQIGSFWNGPGSVSIDLDQAYFTSNTWIRFYGSIEMDNDEGFTIDNVKVKYTRYSTSTYNYIVKLASPLPTGYSLTTSALNTAQFSSQGTSDCSNLFGLAGADLEVTKEIDNSSPNVGDQVTFTITVSNLGTTNATGVLVDDLLPSGYEYVSDNSGGSYDDGTGEWSIGNLSNGANTSLQIVANILTSGIYENIAIVDGDQEDPIGTNNTDTISIVPETEADLSISKSASSDPVVQGQALTYTLTVTNNGPALASDVVITDAITAFPSPLYSLNPGGPFSSSWTGSYNLGTLANGSSFSIYIRGTVPVSTCSDLSNTASVSSFDDPTNSNDQVILSTGISDITNPTVTSCPSNVSSNVDVGECNYTYNPTEPAFNDNCSVTSITWAITGATTGTGSNSIGSTDFSAGISTITYTAKDAANNSVQCIFTITVTDNINPTITCPSNITTTCSATTSYSNYSAFSSAGGSASDNCSINSSSFALLSEVSNSGSPIEIFTRIYEIEDNIGNSATCSQTITVNNETDLSLTKIVDNSTPNYGTNITFTITVTNNGPCSVTNVKVKDLLQTGLAYVSYTATAGTYNSITGEWDFSSEVLANSDTETLTVTATVGDCGDIDNFAEIISSSRPDPDSTPNNNQ